MAVFPLFALGSLAARTIVAQDLRESRREETPAAATATRLIPLYYVRDAEKVIATVRGPVESSSGPPASPRAERLQSLAEERRRLQSQQAALMTPRASPTSPPTQPAVPTGRILEAAGLVSTPPPASEQDRAMIERELALLDRQEQALRAEDFRDQAQSATAGRPVASEARESPRAVDQVRITVLGEGQLHLRGPLEGVNAIARMIHEIDQPVGQVKLGIHVVQFTGQEDSACDSAPGLVDRYLAHARQMSDTSQSLFRAALSAVAGRCYSMDPNGFEEAFFDATCVRNFRSLNGAQATVSIALLDSRDIVTTLYLTSLATNEARHEILAEFQRLVAAELPRRHEEYQQAIAAARGRPAKSPSLLARMTGTGASDEADSQPAPRVPDLSFSKTLSYLEPYGGQPNSAHPMQVATARFQRALLALRQAEVFAAFVEMTDHEIGRVIDASDQTGQLDNTLVILIYGDNGTSAEGGRNGMFSEMTYFNAVQETVPEMLKFIDKWGGPETYPHMAAGWAVMFDTPFTWTKQVASDHGGTKVGTAIQWPQGIKAQGELRTQFHHVIDVAPTILEAAGLPEPKIVNGVKQRPMDGVSMISTFADANAKDRHVTQYFEMFGNRAMYHDGWFARTIHRAPRGTKPRRGLTEDLWELYDTRSDFSLVNDLAAEHPDKLKELQAMFLKEAEDNFALPIDDRVFERILAENVGRPDLMAGRTSITLAEGMTGMSENAFLSIKNKSVGATPRER